MEYPSISEMQAESNRVWGELLQTDLDLSATFIDLLYTKLTIDHDSAIMSLECADKAFDAIARLSKNVDAERRREIERRLKDLRTRLDEAHDLARTQAREP